MTPPSLWKNCLSNVFVFDRSSTLDCSVLLILKIMFEGNLLIFFFFKNSHYFSSTSVALKILMKQTELLCGYVTKCEKLKKYKYFSNDANSGSLEVDLKLQKISKLL